jgi:hypothetical protein
MPAGSKVRTLVSQCCHEKIRAGARRIYPEDDHRSGIDLFFFLNQFLFLLLGWAGNVRDQIKYPHQQSTKDEKAKKQLWLPVQKVDENQCKNDDDDDH